MILLWICVILLWICTCSVHSYWTFYHDWHSITSRCQIDLILTPKSNRSVFTSLPSAHKATACKVLYTVALVHSGYVSISACSEFVSVTRKWCDLLICHCPSASREELYKLQKESKLSKYYFNLQTVVVYGGLGGRGNKSFVTSNMQAPMVATKGQQGQQRKLALELKTIAHAGLVRNYISLWYQINLIKEQVDLNCLIKVANPFWTLSIGLITH